jgi:hypothetical protein
MSSFQIICVHASSILSFSFVKRDPIYVLQSEKRRVLGFFGLAL